MIKELIIKEKRKIFIASVILLYVLIGVLIWNDRISLTGKVIDEKGYSRVEVNMNFTEDNYYELNLDNNITALLLSGKVIGDGSVKVYLDDLLIVDSTQLQKSGISSITGMAIEDTNEEIVLTTEPTEIIEENISQTLVEETQESVENVSVEKEETVVENITVIEENITEISVEIIEENANEIVENVSASNESIINETLIENIIEIVNETILENITVEQNVTEEIIIEENVVEFKNYCIDTCLLDNYPKQIKLRIEVENAVLVLDEIIVKEVKQELIVIDETNLTYVNQSLAIIESNVSNVEINKPVKWSAMIDASKIDKFVLPKESFNITSDREIKIRSKEKLVSIKEYNEKKGQRLLEKEKVKKGLTLIAQAEVIEDEIELILENVSDMINIEYYTPGPEVKELEVNKYKKLVTVSSELDYQNIFTYTNISETNKDFIKVYWVKDTGKELFREIEYIDTNNNGLIDKLQWIIPHLSNQTFEISISVLNPYTYLRDGETWVVAFETTGIANLTISSPNAGWAEFLNDNNETFDEMKFIDIKCGETVLNNNLKLIDSVSNTYDYSSLKDEDSIDIQKLIIENYECNSTGYLSNYMLKAGYAELMFDFSSQNITIRDYAYDPVYPAQGMVIYGKGDNATRAFYRIWNSSDFGSEMETPEIAGGSQVQWVVSRSSTIRDEVAVGLVDNDGDILFNIYNVTADSWENWIDVANIGLTNDIYRAFAIQTEATTGDFLVVYEKNTTADRNLGYMTWDGSAWSEEGILTFSSGSAAEQQTIVRLDRKPGSEEIMMACFGGSDDISVARWDGDSWENHTTITTNSANVNEELMSLEYESISGDAMLAWGNATIANYNIFDNTTKAWSSIQPIRNRGAVVQQITLCADPNSDYIGAIIGPDSGADLLAVMWDGNNWLAGEPSEETQVQNSVMANAYCSWSNSSDSAFFSFVDNTGLTIRYFTYNKTDDAWKCTENNQTITSLNSAEGANGPCTSTASMNDDINVLRSLPDKDSNKIMLWGIDIDLNFETFLFNGTHIEQPETNLLEMTAGWLTTTEPGFFSYLRYPGASESAGVAFYGEFNESQYLRYRIFNGIDFEEEKTAPDLGPGTSMNYIMVKSSPTHNQTAIGILDDDGDLNVNIHYAQNNTFRGWETFSHVGVTNSVYRGFDIQPEGVSGDILIVYERNFQNGTTDLLLYYRIWNGSTWGPEENITLVAPATVDPQTHIGLNSIPGSDEIMLASIGVNDDLSVARWDGDSWENITTITTDAANVNEDRFNIAYESISGDAMLAWGNATIANYNIFDNTTKAWSTHQVIRDRGAVVQQITLCADPNSDYIGAIIGPDSAGDVLAVIWNGTNWLSGEPIEEDVAENTVVTNTFCRWTNTSTALFTYIDDGAFAIRYFVYNKTENSWKCTENNDTVTSLTLGESAGGPCTTGNIMSDDIEVLRYVRDPTRDEMMMWGNDLAEDFEMFIFNGTHIRQPATALLETVTPTASTIEPGYFDYFKFNLGYLEEPTQENNVPIITEIVLTPSNPNTLSTLECNATVNDAENETLQIEWFWYNNSILHSLGNTSVVNNTNSIITTIGEGNTTTGEIWNCTVRAYDGDIYSNFTSATATITSSAPEISYVQGGQSATPIESSTREVWITFNVSHLDGISQLNDSTAVIRLNKTGEVLRNSTLCVAQSNDTVNNVREYNCSIYMQYYDQDGTWAVNASIKDNSDNYAENTAEVFTYGTLTSMVLGKASMNFSSVSLGQVNIPSDQNPMIIDNTGNQNISVVNITAFDLIKDSEVLNASYFTMNASDGLGSGYQLQNNTPIRINNSFIPRDLGGIDQNGSLYLYVTIPSSGLTTGSFNSSSLWLIDVE